MCLIAEIPSDKYSEGVYIIIIYTVPNIKGE